MDGEKELVLGNKQLVSFFFVVLALCGVFFALGYMIGTNSAKAVVSGLDGNPATVTADGQRAQESEPPRETGAVEPSPRAGTSTDAPNAAPVPAEATSQNVPQTQPAHDTPASVYPSPQTATGPAAAAVPPPVAAPSAVTASAQATAATLATPEPGAMYLQVRALHRADAETLVKTLREQKYPALLATSSKADFFRVLVGPYHQTAEIADTKARLKTLGFADAFVLK